MRAHSIKWKAHLVTAILLTLFLFFIDEGYYSFRWMLELGAWVAFVIYVAAIWGFQILLAFPLKFILKDPVKTWLSAFAGSAVGLVFVIYVIFRTSV